MPLNNNISISRQPSEASQNTFTYWKTNLNIWILNRHNFHFYIIKVYGQVFKLNILNKSRCCCKQQTGRYIFLSFLKSFPGWSLHRVADCWFRLHWLLCIYIQKEEINNAKSSAHVMDTANIQNIHLVKCQTLLNVLYLKVSSVSNDNFILKQFSNFHMCHSFK